MPLGVLANLRRPKRLHFLLKLVPSHKPRCTLDYTSQGVLPSAMGSL